jgi:hypothetical protein
MISVCSFPKGTKTHANTDCHKDASVPSSDRIGVKCQYHVVVHNKVRGSFENCHKTLGPKEFSAIFFLTP